MTNDRITPAEAAQVKELVEAIAETIQSLGSVPSGHLYARVMGYLTLAQYEAIISVLVEQKRVSRANNHLLTWIGTPDPRR